MSAIFKKLNLKDQAELLVLNAPASFEPELAALGGVRVHRAAAGLKAIPFVLAFATKLKEVEALARLASQKTVGDAVVWCAYPKGTSKTYTCEFNRDTGWAALGAAGFEPVRQVAIDADWSALRFRRAAFIQKMTRAPKTAISRAGRKRAAR